MLAGRGPRFRPENQGHIRRCIFSIIFFWPSFHRWLPLFLAKVIFSRKKRKIFAQKLGFIPEETLAGMKGEPRIWVHAVSLGEVSAAPSLDPEIAEVYPEGCLMLSTGTESGQKIARERVMEATGTFFFPPDFPFVVRKVIRQLRPDLFVIAETELWPNFLRIVKEEGAKALLVNGRISERSFKRYRKIRFFWTAVLDNFDAMSMMGSRTEKELSPWVRTRQGLGQRELQIRPGGPLRQPSLSGRDEKAPQDRGPGAGFHCRVHP